MIINLRDKKSLVCLIGIAIAIGVAILLQEKSKRIEFSIKETGNEKETKEARRKIKSIKKGLKEKEQQLIEGRAGKIKERVSKGISKKSSESLDEFISKAKIAKVLKDAVVEYITDGMEDKLEELGVNKDKLKKTVNLVAETTEQVLLSLDIEELVETDKPLKDQILRVVKKIRPALLEQLKHKSINSD